MRCCCSPLCSGRLRRGGVGGGAEERECVGVGGGFYLRLPSQFMSWGLVSESVRKIFLKKKHKTTGPVVSSAVQEGYLRGEHGMI